MANTSRIPAKAGHANWAKLPKGPNGRALCRQCGKETPGKRTTFCSAECVHDWKLTTQPAYQAARVFERDKGVCESCGRDCVALLAELKRLRAESRRAQFPTLKLERYTDEIAFPFDAKVVAFRDRCLDLGLARHLASLTRRLWEMDHRIPVVEGGGGCGLDNLRTLCWACHRLATAELAARRAAARRVQQDLPIKEARRDG